MRDLLVDLVTGPDNGWIHDLAADRGDCRESALSLTGEALTMTDKYRAAGEEFARAMKKMAEHGISEAEATKAAKQLGKLQQRRTAFLSPNRKQPIPRVK